MLHFAERLVNHEALSSNLEDNAIKISDGNLYVFVSFSMGDQAISQMIKSARKHGAIVVLRGLYKNSMKETIAKLSDALKQGGIVIDPNLFAKYSITSVPTFVLENKDRFDVLRGNVSVKFTLEKFASSGDLKECAKNRL